MIEEETKDLVKLQKVAGYYRAYSTSLEKELKEKNVEIGKLKVSIQEMEHEKKRVKGDLHAYRKEAYTADLHKQIKELKKDNDKLICKIGTQHGNKS